MSGLSDRIKAVRRLVEESVSGGYATGMVALLGQGDERAVVFAGRTALDGAVAMERTSLFRIASMTKPVTAVAAMMLVEEGKLALDEPIDRLLPELADRRVLKRIDAALDDTEPAARPITVEDLLTFRLGLGIVFAPPGAYPILSAIEERKLVGFGMPDPSNSVGPDEWMARLGELPLMAQPGARWLYTAGSNLLGVLIARAAGMPLPDLFQRRIFEPLGMVDTAFYAPADKIGRLTTAYRPEDGALALLDPAAGGAWSRPPAFPAGDSGLVSTVDDFRAFSRMLLNGGRAGGRRLLSEDSVQAMTRDYLTPEQRADGEVILGPGRGWGFGLAVALEDTPDGAPAGAYGWNGGLGTSWLAHPVSDTMAILLTQTAFESPDPPAVHKAVWRAAFAG
jgi:CubicO group peptidase (beta-lactamase class C family)